MRIVSQLTFDFNPMKRCNKCGTEKPEDTFEMQPSKGRRRAVCRQCRLIEGKQWRDKRKVNPPQHIPETKQCRRCKEVKPTIGNFSPGNPGYFHNTCRACENEMHHEKRRQQYLNDPTGRFYLPFENEEGITVKRCAYCHDEKPLTEYYSNGTHGRHGKCKQCDHAIQKMRYDADPEKYRTKSLNSMRKYPERVRARRERWHSTNHERILLMYHASHMRHREKRLAHDRMRHIRDFEKERHYRQTHQDIVNDSARRRRARKMNAAIVEKIDRKALIERDNWTCYLCLRICTPKNVTLDHVVPLFRGGNHTADNLRVACGPCNYSKGTKLLGEFLK